MKLADLLDRSRLDVPDRQLTVPVIDSLQAQGDLIVLPLSMIGGRAILRGSWLELPAEGFELARGKAGKGPYTLVANSGTCRLASRVKDPEHLAITAFVNTATVYLVHPDHGAIGIAPGSWAVRRRRGLGIAA